MKNRIVFLDCLRIFAFLSVLVGHKFYPKLAAFASDPGVHDSFKWIIKSALPLYWGGGAGVVVFFLISGYIVAYILQTEQGVQFIIKRIFRIYPLYMAAVLLQAMLAFFIDHEPLNIHFLIPQLLLLQKIYHVPDVLAGVDWTLQVEMSFYGFMFILCSLGFLDRHKSCLPYVLILFTIFLTNLLPNYFDYRNYLGLFCFLGIFFFLYEKKLVRFELFLFYICLVFVNYWILIAQNFHELGQYHFCILAFLLFIIIWYKQDCFSANKLTIWLSELTYSIYLFHNWLYERLLHIFQQEGYALIALFFICSLFVKFVERPGIRLGRKIALYFKDLQISAFTLTTTERPEDV